MMEGCMRDWLQESGRLLADNTPHVLVLVIAAHGSAPREAGTAMLVTDSEALGTIGGGNLEHTATNEARALLKASHSVEIRAYPLGPMLDQCCGGHVTLAFIRLTAEDSSRIDAIKLTSDWRLLIRNGAQPDYEFIKSKSDADHLLPNERVVLLDQNGERSHNPRMDVADIGEVVVALGSPYAPLYIFGAGHVGQAVASIIRYFPFDVIWVDHRAHLFPENMGNSIKPVVSDDPLSIISSAPKGALYLIFTHSHPLDYAITAAILARGDAGYCGLIGSETKRARFISRFRDEEGFDEEQIARMTCPIGLGGPPGKEPHVIALGVVSELLDVVRT